MYRIFHFLLMVAIVSVAVPTLSYASSESKEVTEKLEELVDAAKDLIEAADEVSDALFVENAVDLLRRAPQPLVVHLHYCRVRPAPQLPTDFSPAVKAVLLESRSRVPLTIHLIGFLGYSVQNQLSG